MSEPHLPSRILVFNEADYRFGTGILLIKILRLHGVAYSEAGVDWVQVWAQVYSWDGRGMGLRAVYIRADRLAAAQRR